jgi:predicted MFS family arabinose efflux permease
MIGNMAAARFADRATLRATMAGLVILVIAVVLSSRVPAVPLLLFPLLAIWGAAHMAAITLCQVRVTLAGHTASAFAMAMNIASANLGIALGAVAGGFVVDAWGVNAIGWGAAGLMVIVAAAAAATAKLERNARTHPADKSPAGGPCGAR